MFNGANALYTYNGETIILVDTTILREVRVVVNTGMKFRVTIVDAMGTGAHVNPITVTVFGSAAAPEFGGGQRVIRQKRGNLTLVSEGDTWYTHPTAGSLGKRVFPAMILFPEVLNYPVTIGANQTGLGMDYTLVGPGAVTISPGGVLVTA